MQFRLIPQGDGRFTFQVQDESNVPILDSPVFFNRESCIASIRGFIDQIRVTNAVGILHENGLFYFTLKDETGEVWMRSLGFDRKENLEEILNNLKEKASDNTSFEVTMRRKLDMELPALPTEINYADLYDFSLLSNSKKVGFHTIQSEKNQKYYFLFNNNAGTPILYSCSFSTASQRDKRIQAIIKQADNPHKYEVLQNTDNSCFILKGSNDKEIARSRAFDSVEEMNKSIDWLMMQIPRCAAEYGVNLDTDVLQENFLIEVTNDDKENEILIPVKSKFRDDLDRKQSQNPMNKSSRLARSKKYMDSPSEFSVLWKRVWPWLLGAFALFVLLLIANSY